MERPYIISWNLTYRCNLACEHCYLDAGASRVRKVTSEGFADRSEMGTEECFRVIDEICDAAPESILILTGGEPLLRRDIIEIIRYAVSKQLWVVVGTNGVKITEPLAEVLKNEGVRGLALSLDALTAESHDKFRAVKGAFENTVQGAKILHSVGLPFIIQTTVAKHNLESLEAISDFAHSELGAKVWNLYFLVQTGRGPFISDISKEDYDSVLLTLSKIQQKYFSKMIVNAKCAPHYVRHLFENDPDSSFLKTFTSGAGGCPAGTHYIGIRPNGDVTPCPYLPVFGGNLRDQSLKTIWNESEVFSSIRNRKNLGGRCGSCEFGGVCGGCRARAFGMTGDYLAEDPLCSFQPGRYSKESIERGFKVTAVEYGISLADRVEVEITWTDEANERISRIPRFVRGMVVKAVESHCAKNGISVVTGAELEKIRARIPTQKIF